MNGQGTLMISSFRCFYKLKNYYGDDPSEVSVLYLENGDWVKCDLKSLLPNNTEIHIMKEIGNIDVKADNIPGYEQQHEKSIVGQIHYEMGLEGLTWEMPNEHGVGDEEEADNSEEEADNEKKANCSIN